MKVFCASIIGSTICASAALAQQVPEWNISGQDWVCSQICQAGLAGRPTPIAQDGRLFILTNEAGATSNGVFQSGYTIRVTGWNLTAIVSRDLKTLTFPMERSGRDSWVFGSSRYGP
jgi:hypothetical protein